MQTMGEILRRNALLHPERAAVIHDEAQMTFAGQLARGNRLAAALWAIGLRPGDRVAMLAMNCLEYIDVWSAGELAGFMITPINFRLAAPEIQWILDDAKPRALIFEGQYAELVGAVRDAFPDLHCLCVGGPCPPWAEAYGAFVAGGSADGAPSRPAPGDPLSLMYTSGTTGRPKGVIRSNLADFNTGRSCAEELGLAPGDRYLLMMPWFHLGSRGQQMAAHWRGATVIMHRGFDAARVLADIERHRVTCVHMAPTLVHDCFEHPDIDRRDLSSLKTLYYAAAPMPLPLLRRALAKLGPIFVNGYGSTESTGLCLHKIDHVLDGPPEEVARLKSVGQPMINCEARIIDDQWNPLPPGSVGEIAIRGDGVMDGYWNNHAATLEVLRDGWFRTGDMGYADSRNFIFLVDRKKDMIISGGENIYSREVEEAICLHADVAEVAVIGVADARWGEVVRALVVRRAGAALSAQDIIDHSRAMIARYKAPKSVLFVDALPRLANGKIDKRRLREEHGTQ